VFSSRYGLNCDVPSFLKKELNFGLKLLENFPLTDATTGWKLKILEGRFTERETIVSSAGYFNHPYHHCDDKLKMMTMMKTMASTFLK
jgi:hypothetical protein